MNIKINKRLMIEFIFMSTMNLFIPLAIQLFMHKELIWYFYLQGVVNFTSYFLVINKRIEGIYLYIIAILITIFIDYNDQVYGDALLRILWILPLQIKILIQHFITNSSLKNKQNKIIFHSWSKTEMFYTFILMLILIFIIGVNLQNIYKIPILNLVFKKNDPYIYLDAMSVVANLSAQYHFSKLHRNWYLLNIIADVPLIIIWLNIFLKNSGSGSIILVFSNLSFAILSTYALIRELKIEKYSYKNI